MGRAGRTGCRQPCCPAGPEPLLTPGGARRGSCPPPTTLPWPLRLRSPGRDHPQSVLGDVSATFGYDHRSTPHITSLPGTGRAAAPARLGPAPGQQAGEREHLGLVGRADGGLLSLLVELSTASCSGCGGSGQGGSERPGLTHQWLSGTSPASGVHCRASLGSRVPTAVPVWAPGLVLLFLRRTPELRKLLPHKTRVCPPSSHQLPDLWALVAEGPGGRDEGLWPGMWAAGAGLQHIPCLLSPGRGEPRGPAPSLPQHWPCSLRGPPGVTTQGPWLLAR